MTETLKNFFATLTAMLRDEDGAESSEVILVIVLLVVGLMGAWAFLRGKIGGQASHVGGCIGSANTATTC